MSFQYCAGNYVHPLSNFLYFSLLLTLLLFSGDANDEGVDGSLPKPPALDRVRAKARSTEDELAELKAWKRRRVSIATPTHT